MNEKLDIGLNNKKPLFMKNPPKRFGSLTDFSTCANSNSTQSHQVSNPVLHTSRTFFSNSRLSSFFSNSQMPLPSSSMIDLNAKTLNSNDNISSASMNDITKSLPFSDSITKEVNKDVFQSFY
ncbi:hypothetical protein HDU92_005688 [Lobulomyces angularis]|nr:hypothetical protein HDU92_005688 [Lobulomyces angularis]